MIDVEDLPPIEMACRLTGELYYSAALYCLQIVEKNILEQAEPREIPFAAICAGYVAGVRHERKRQRQRATAGKKAVQKEKAASAGTPTA